MISRRGFIGALLAAPAIIRSPGLLMPIKPVIESLWEECLVAFDPALGPDATTIGLYQYQTYSIGYVILNDDVERGLSAEQIKELVKAQSERYDRLLARSMRPI